MSPALFSFLREGVMGKRRKKYGRPLKERADEYHKANPSKTYRIKPLVPAWRKGPLGESLPFVMPSGKYAGKEPADVPFDYLWGAGDAGSFGEATREFVLKEIARRIELGNYLRDPAWSPRPSAPAPSKARTT